MTKVATIDEAEGVIAGLRAMETELRRSGIEHLALFGSMARGEANAKSDIDLAVLFDPAARMDLLRLIGLERRLSEAFGRPVEFTTLPIKSQGLRASVERDSLSVF